MSQYDYDINKWAVEALPPDKRMPTTIKIIQSLLSGVKWIHSLIFTDFYEGASAPDYAIGNTYNYLDKVIFNKKLYMSLSDNNSYSPDYSGQGWWLMIQDNFVGIKERILYCGAKLVLEYALNKQFDGIFKQPDIGLSDIYITNVSSVPDGFFVGLTEPYCSSVGQTYSSDYIGSNLPFVYINNFQINVKTSILDVSIDSNEKSVRNFVDKYIPASLKYLIVNY